MQRNIDQIVEHFLSGKRNSIARAHALYQEKLFGEQEGAPEDFEYCGTVIPEEQLGYDSNDYDRLEGYVTDERSKALSKGAEPTEEEKQEYRRRIIADVEDGTADADGIPGYWVRPLRHTDGRMVFALETVKGYSFSGVENTFHGLFSSVEDAVKDLSTWGFVVRA